MVTFDSVIEHDCDAAWFAEIGRRERALVADVFITCDDKLSKRAKLMQLPLKLYNPVDFAYDMEARKL